MRGAGGTVGDMRGRRSYCWGYEGSRRSVGDMRGWRSYCWGYEGE